MPTYNTSAKVNDTDGNSTASVSLTAGAGSRRLLEVWVMVTAGSPGTHNSVTWGGVSLTQRGTTLSVGSFGRLSKWFLKEASFPSGATGNVVATCSASQDQIVIMAMICNDVNQTSPYANASQTTATGAAALSASLTVTSVTGALVTAGVLGANSTTEATGISATSGTARQTQAVAGGDFASMGIATLAGGSPNVTQSWSFTMSGGDTMSDWGMVGDSLTDDTGGGGGTTLSRVWWDMIGMDDV